MNEEQHPWIVFPETKKGNKLILGSFPPKRFTINPQNLPKNDINFFYGSSDNKFWEMFCISKGLNYNWRLSPEKLKNYGSILFIMGKYKNIIFVYAKFSRNIFHSIRFSRALVC